MVGASQYLGFDIETQDHDRHEGLNQFMKVDGEGYGKNQKLVFDTNRTTITGFSIYPDSVAQQNPAFYFNLNHADKENALGSDKGAAIIREIMAARSPHNMTIAHNAPFELVMVKKSLGVQLTQMFCSMQLCVSAYSPDQYNISEFMGANLDAFAPLLTDIQKTFASQKELAEEEINDLVYEDESEYDDSADEELLKVTNHDERQKLLSKVVSKETKSSYSYMGFLKPMILGYGLKQAVKSWFNYQMVEFKDVLGKNPHMGCLTGEQTAFYGCDDAFWAVQLFKRVLIFMAEENPPLLNTFFEQENPMIYVYADVFEKGMKIDLKKVQWALLEERKNYANEVRRLRSTILSIIGEEGIWPDSEEHNARSVSSLMKRQDWYAKNPSKYRERIVQWALEGDSSDDFTEVMLCRGSLPTQWAEEKGYKLPKDSGINFTHYMPQRVLYHDLCGLTPVIGGNGKIETDRDARNALAERIKKQHNQLHFPNESLAILDSIAKLSGTEQRIKLYIKTYLQLTDPETGRVYPVLSSRLATRRMATQNPNPMQLSKSGYGSYIRSFYKPDRDDHLIVSIDWSQIELVTIAEFSGDKNFLKCYQTLPYDDLHSFSASGILGMTLDEYKNLRKLPEDMRSWETAEGKEIYFKSFLGEPLSPAAFYKEMRRDVGKGSNFEYWYSGSLYNLGNKLNWSREEREVNNNRYREQFPDAENWRLQTQAEAAIYGYVELPDHHRRFRFENTSQWYHLWTQKWQALPGGMEFAKQAARAIQRRAANQAVNAKIQGTNAILAKRSILRINEQIQKQKFDARFLCPVHDELMFSVKTDQILDFLPMAKGIMCHHPEIFTRTVLDATAAIGKNYQAFHMENNPEGLFELDEASPCHFLPKDRHEKKLGQAEILQVIEYMQSI